MGRGIGRRGGGGGKFYPSDAAIPPSVGVPSRKVITCMLHVHFHAVETRIVSRTRTRTRTRTSSSSSTDNRLTQPHPRSYTAGGGEHTGADACAGASPHSWRFDRATMPIHLARDCRLARNPWSVCVSLPALCLMFCYAVH